MQEKLPNNTSNVLKQKFPSEKNKKSGGKVLFFCFQVQCCCFSPGKAILVFAGTSVGSVVLWDLREPASNHYSLKIGENEWTIRQPTFSTGEPNELEPFPLTSAKLAAQPEKALQLQKLINC